MKQNNMKTVNEVLMAGELAAGGLNKIGVAIGVTQNNEANMRAAITAAINGRDAYEQAKVELDRRRQVVDSVDKTGLDLLMVTRDVLKLKFGTQYSQAWDAAGFRGSLRLPRRLGDIPPRVQAMKSYLTANAADEVAPLNVTAARFDTVYTDMCTARTDVNQQVSEVKRLLLARDLAIAMLRTRIKGLLNELRVLIGFTDTRYKLFGFNIPGAPATPDAPVNVIALLIGPNAVALKWDAAARAEHYRVWKKVVGVDEEFIAVDSRADLDCAIEGLPSNATIQIAVSAVNLGGESAKSEVVTVTTA